MGTVSYYSHFRGEGSIAQQGPMVDRSLDLPALTLTSQGQHGGFRQVPPLTLALIFNTSSIGSEVFWGAGTLEGQEFGESKMQMDVNLATNLAERGRAEDRSCGAWKTG